MISGTSWSSETLWNPGLKTPPPLTILKLPGVSHRENGKINRGQKLGQRFEIPYGEASFNGCVTIVQIGTPRPKRLSQGFADTERPSWGLN